MLGFAARHGRWCLIAGLVAGLALPALAQALQPHLPVMIAALLFLNAFRIGPRTIWTGLRGDRSTVGIIVLYQLVAPLVALGLTLLLGLGTTTAALAMVLMCAAPSVTGSANFAILMNHQPEAALRLLMVGTAAFPITVLPVLLLVPALDTASVLVAALRLMAIVALAGLAALVLRRGPWTDLTPSQQHNIDGASSILLGVVVVGLMSAVGPMLWAAPLTFLMWLGFATTLNFGLQILAWRTVARAAPRPDWPAISIVAGNRNIALFLVALPAEITVPLLGFIGCYQIPMYLTPLVLRRVYAGAQASQ